MEKYRASQKFYEACEEFINKYSNVDFYDLDFKEGQAKSVLQGLIKKASIEAITDSLQSKELTEYIDDIIIGKEISDKEAGKYGIAVREILTEEYSKVREDNYKTKKAVQDLFQQRRENDLDYEKSI